MKIVVVNGKAYELKDGDTMELIPIESGQFSIKAKDDLRTAAQNRALHKYFYFVADALSSAGLDIKHVIKADVPWSAESVKEIIWKPVQKAILNKKSTTRLKKDEIDVVYNTINRLLGEKYGVHVPFPSEEERRYEQILKEAS